MVHKVRGEGEEQTDVLLVLPNDLDQVDLLADGAQLYDVVNITDGDAEEEVHDYDGYDADEDQEDGLARVGEYVRNGRGLQCGAFGSVWVLVLLQMKLCAVHQIIVADFPGHH